MGLAGGGGRAHSARRQAQARMYCFNILLALMAVGLAGGGGRAHSARRQAQRRWPQSRGAGQVLFNKSDRQGRIGSWLWGWLGAADGLTARGGRHS
jgi:hypothetical protein